MGLRCLRGEGPEGRIGQVNIQRYWRNLLETVVRGEFDPTFVISHRWPLDKAAEAYEMFDAKEDNCVKPSCSRRSDRDTSNRCLPT